MTVIIDSKVNIGDGILQLFPTAIPSQDFKVEYDGVSFKLIEWKLPQAVPSVQELENAHASYQVNKPSNPKSQIEIMQDQIDMLTLQLLSGGK